MEHRLIGLLQSGLHSGAASVTGEKDRDVEAMLSTHSRGICAQRVQLPTVLLSAFISPTSSCLQEFSMTSGNVTYGIRSQLSGRDYSSALSTHYVLGCFVNCVL